MIPDLAVRRFELYGSTQSLDAAADALQAARKGQPRDGVEMSIDPVVRPPMLTVWLKGSVLGTGIVRESVRGVDGVRVHRDWLDVIGADDRYPDRRSLARIDFEGRSRGRRSRSEQPVVVAVVDSGIATDHPDLRHHLWTATVGGQQVHGARFVDGAHDFDVTDQDGHGTMLAGTILGTAGAVDGIRIMPVKIFDVPTEPTARSAARGIRWAVEHGARIVNLSFDLGIGSTELRESIENACDAGALVVIAAGNTGGNNDHYPTIPAAYVARRRERIIVVMATDAYDEKPTFSNFGVDRVDLAAPGVGIVSTRSMLSYDGPPPPYGRYSGTSPAAAQVTGAAALLKSQRPEWMAEDLKARLLETVDALPHLRRACASGGRLNLGRALG
jgi:thermitase